MSTPSQGGMSARQKAIGAAAIVFIVLAIALIFRMYQNTQPHVVQQINLPVGSSEKMQEMRKGAEAAGESPSDRINLHGGGR